MKQGIKIFPMLVILLSLPFELIASGQEQLKSSTFTLDLVPQFDARAVQHNWRPIFDELEEKTSFYFVLQRSVTIPYVENNFNLGKFYFSYMSPFHALTQSQVN